MDLTKLSKIGLTKGEIKVYLALIKHSSQSKTHLAIKANVSSSKVYEIAEKLNIKNLEDRIKQNNISEIILALNPTIEGETTSMYLNTYLNRYLNKYNFKITKLARGLPQGSDLEYADEITLANAFKGRIKA